MNKFLILSVLSLALFSCAEENPDCIFEPDPNSKKTEKLENISHIPRVVYNDSLSVLTLCSDDNHVTVDQITPGMSYNGNFIEEDLNNDGHLDVKIVFEDSSGTLEKHYIYHADSAHYHVSEK